MVALPILMSKSVFKEGDAMRSLMFMLMFYVHAKLREFKEWFKNPTVGFDFTQGRLIPLPYPHGHRTGLPPAAPLAIL